jgi:predicted restriction endonuclease
MKEFAWNSTLRKPRKPMKRTAMKKHRESPAETRFKRAVRERDNYTCQFPGCGYQSKHIDVHHKGKRSLRPDLKLDVDNAICLCREHHERTDRKRQEAISLGLLETETYELAKKREGKAA